ncbi:MAG: Fur family transcriptional regulator [Pseudomonadota bacterium]|nr:Fur family transcriptional regulator [Pseudomonadota bacterium]
MSPARHSSTSTPTPKGADATLRQRLSSAAAHCAHRGAQLTAQRAEVLELLLRRGGQAKAYDLQQDMQARHDGRTAPTTVYRALEFLQAQHLVHKVDATNTFVACNHADHGYPAVMLICLQCERIDEIHDDKAAASLLAQARQHGFVPQAVEVKSLCSACQPAR